MSIDDLMTTDLGFLHFSKGRQGHGYIALGEQREPLDQTDLRDGIDATLRIDGGTF